ncbi:DNA-binding MarR family transcriptional regulator [Sphingomonas vulcanisoli]|uniref:DNA-binding MarR family transcriptional regulator n=1 Tax=Sphingomonas vulcanisoli TaxID=1658060 RepID=A0ABX0TT75_9SPHN|nr:MarR family transcriptional regulator [Sphingomonas vulcanisoli]NIJ08722.1 DNA-binding MarR family transcriptional regulator [Sphingomonas vulcanisoli]
MIPPEITDQTPRLRDPVVGGVDIREIAGCTCLRLRRSTRIATQLFDAHIAASGVTIGQFGVLAQLHGVSVWRDAISIKGLADLIGMDPTTLLRTLKPLEQKGWVASAQDQTDRRSRLVHLTDLGRDQLASAAPYWEAAQRELRQKVGEETALALNGLLDLAGRKLQLD